MFYVFHGQDEYSQRETLGHLMAKLGDGEMLGLNTSRFEGGKVTVPALRDSCDTVPFLTSVRLVICEEVLGKMPASTLKELVAYLPNLPDSTRLIFLESQKLSPTHPILQLVEKVKNGYAKEFSPLQGNILEKWVTKRVADSGGQISPAAAHLLATSLNGDVRALANEVEKLVLYKLGKGPIEVADVALLCPYAAEANIFDLVDALGSRQSKRAGQLLQQKRRDGTDPFYLFSMILRQFRLLLQVKSLMDKGLKAPAIASQLKMSGYVVNKIFQQAQQFSLAQLKQIYGHLLEMDLGVKTGKMDMDTGLDLFVAGITHETSLVF